MIPSVECHLTMMAGGVGGGQTPSSLYATTAAETINVSANNHINEDDLFLHSNASDLLPCGFSVNTVVDQSTRRNNGKMSSQQSMHYQEEINDHQKKHVNNSYYSKGYSDDPSSIEIFENKKRGKTKKKSNSTISSNTSSSYSSSSGVESMTAGINGECNNMSDKDKIQETCSSVIDCSKEATYAVGQWLGFLQMENYLQVPLFQISLDVFVDYNHQLVHVS